ncbi:MAG: hypothetical protein ACLFVO_00055 [Chloroflexaceae bacterium]
MKTFVFFEGATEKHVCNRIARIMSELDLDTGSGQGKRQINAEMRKKLGPFLTKQQPIRCLILRDLDEHDHETTERLVQSIQDAWRDEFQKRGVQHSIDPISEHPDHDNVFMLAMTDPDLRLALHIATYRWREEFIKATIDDYVLTLALESATAAALIAHKPWQASAGHIIDKVTRQIPELLRNNGIPLQEAKDYVRLYAAVIQEHTSPPVFAQKVLAHVTDERIRSVFAPLVAACEFIRGGR